MRILTLLILTTAIALSLRELGLVQAASAALAPAPLGLEFQWMRRDGGHTYRMTARALATVIGPHTLLTHNHYPPQLGAQARLSMSLTDASGRVVEVTLTQSDLRAIDAGTLLITLPQRIELEPVSVGGASDVRAVVPGDRLTVQYWDEALGQVAQAELEVVAAEAGVATLADPSLLINCGDSGGGVYRQGVLVGNTWSVDTDKDGQRLGLVHVALLPGALTGGFGSQARARNDQSLEAVLLHAAPEMQ
ncbi:MAG: hypothetical protein IT318_04235 [Anaerolineales bacterium]|nr:hypothetical protein [Anaerolineales bacterium]